MRQSNARELRGGSAVKPRNGDLLVIACRITIHRPCTIFVARNDDRPNRSYGLVLSLNDLANTKYITLPRRYRGKKLGMVFGKFGDLRQIDPYWTASSIVNIPDHGVEHLWTVDPKHVC